MQLRLSLRCSDHWQCSLFWAPLPDMCAVFSIAASHLLPGDCNTSFNSKDSEVAPLGFSVSLWEEQLPQQVGFPFMHSLAGSCCPQDFPLIVLSHPPSLCTIWQLNWSCKRKRLTWWHSASRTSIQRMRTEPKFWQLEVFFPAEWGCIIWAEQSVSVELYLKYKNAKTQWSRVSLQCNKLCFYRIKTENNW